MSQQTEQIDQATEEQLLQMVGYSTKQCPNRGEDVGMNENGIHTEFGYRRFQDQPHKDCHGTGRVSALPELLVDCPGNNALSLPCVNGFLYRMTSEGPKPFQSPHEGCYGTGKEPRRGLEAVLEIGARTGLVGDYAVNLFTLGARRPEGLRFRATCCGHVGLGYTASEACLRALAHALVAQGATLGEVGK